MIQIFLIQSRNVRLGEVFLFCGCRLKSGEHLGLLCNCHTDTDRPRPCETEDRCASRETFSSSDCDAAAVVCLRLLVRTSDLLID